MARDVAPTRSCQESPRPELHLCSGFGTDLAVYWVFCGHIISRLPSKSQNCSVFGTRGGAHSRQLVALTLPARRLSRERNFRIVWRASAINYLMPNGESKHVEILGLAGHCERAGPFKEWAYQGVEGFRLRCGLGRISSNIICSEWPLQIKPPHNPAQPWP